MFVMYVDESGDCGLIKSPTRYFVLSGLVIHESSWQKYIDQLIVFRQKMKQQFGLGVTEEIHSSAFITRPGPLVRIRRNDRLTILRSFADEIASMTDVSVINIVIDKSSKTQNYDVFEQAWQALIQRFENTLTHHNFKGSINSEDYGMIFPDHTDDKKLTGILRRMRRYNPIKNQIDYRPTGFRNLQISRMVEDPNFKDSYFIQAVDLIAFLLQQKLAPNAYMRKKSGQNYFQRLDPVLCKVAARTDPQGIVYL